jgi:hypothetical protein
LRSSLPSRFFLPSLSLAWLLSAQCSSRLLLQGNSFLPCLCFEVTGRSCCNQSLSYHFDWIVDCQILVSLNFFVWVTCVGVVILFWAPRRLWVVEWFQLVSSPGLAICLLLNVGTW